MKRTLEIRNYRCLSHVRWSPSGVCALVGPNGSGKTTLLSVFELLRHGYQRSFRSAFNDPFVGGLWGLKNMLASPEDAVTIRIEESTVLWEVHFVWGYGGLAQSLPESAWTGEELLFERLLHSDTITYGDQSFRSGDELAIRTIYEICEDPRLESLVRTIQNTRVYHDYHLHTLREYGSKQAADQFLHPGGTNAFAILRNWRDKREQKPAFDLVKEGLRETFPDFFEDFDFETAGQSVMLRIYCRGLPEPIPHHLAPNGFLVALLHLCAVAGAQDGSIIAIDELENALHPYAIRRLIEIFRDEAEKRDLTIILATHSPVVLDEFKDDPGRVFIMEPSADELPIPLDKHRNPEWLSQFSLGKLYANLDFGAPQFSAAANGKQ